MDNSVIEINSFNKASLPVKAKTFLRELNRPGAKKRLPNAYLENYDCYFVFVGTTALICIESSDNGSFYFAVDSEKAEACLDETIEYYKDSDLQYDDWRQNKAYIAAAEKLRELLNVAI